MVVVIVNIWEKLILGLKNFEVICMFVVCKILVFVIGLGWVYMLICIMVLLLIMGFFLVSLVMVN